MSSKFLKKKKNILLLAIGGFAVLILIAVLTSLYQRSNEQKSYELRALQNDGKLYPQQEPIGLVQRVVNNPTFTSKNRFVAVAEYLTRMITVNFISEDMSKIYCCELLERYKTPPFYIWEDLNNTQHAYEVIKRTDNQQVIAVKNTYPGYPNKREVYFTVVKTNDGWRVDKYRDLRSLNLLDSYSFDLTDIQPEFYDEVTKSGYQVSKKSATLALKTDAELISYFQQNKEKFNDLLSKMPGTYYQDEVLEHLNLTIITKNYNNNCSECIFFVIAGDKDDTVGYFYLADKSKLPKMSGSELILIREIGDGWYFYKST